MINTAHKSGLASLGESTVERLAETVKTGMGSIAEKPKNKKAKLGFSMHTS